MAAIKAGKRRAKQTPKYYAIRLGKRGGLTPYRNLKTQVAIDIFYSYGEDWISRVKRSPKLPEAVWNYYKTEFDYHDATVPFGGQPITNADDFLQGQALVFFNERFGPGSQFTIRRDNYIDLVVPIDPIRMDDVDVVGPEDSSDDDEP